MSEACRGEGEGDGEGEGEGGRERERERERRRRRKEVLMQGVERWGGVPVVADEEGGFGGRCRGCVTSLCRPGQRGVSV